MYYFHIFNTAIYDKPYFSQTSEGMLSDVFKLNDYRVRCFGDRLILELKKNIKTSGREINV